MVIGAIIWNCWFLPTRNSWILAVSQFTVTQFTVLHSKSLKVRRGFRHWCLPFLRILILRVRSAMLNLFNSNSVLEIMILIRVMGIFIVLIWSPNKSYLGNTSFKYISVKDLLFPVTIDSILCFKQFFFVVFQNKYDSRQTGRLFRNRACLLWYFSICTVIGKHLLMIKCLSELILQKWWSLGIHVLKFRLGSQTFPAFILRQMNWMPPYAVCILLSMPGLIWCY